MSGLRIVKFSSENFKRLRAVEITPDGAMVRITGRNGEGKSSVLDAIWVALAGASAAPAVPVRNGEESAVIRLDLGELIVTRRFTKGGNTSLTVENRDRAVFRSPQKVLDELVGALTFDPLEFQRMKPREQLDTLRALVKIDVDIDALDRANAADYEERTLANRRARELRGAVESYGATPEGLPTDEVDVGKLLDELAQSSETNTDVERRRTNRAETNAQIQRYRDAAADSIGPGLVEAEGRVRAESAAAVKAADERIAKLEVELAAARAEREIVAGNEEKALEAIRAQCKQQNERAIAAADDLQAKLDAAPPLPELVDVQALRDQINAGNETNAQIRAARQRAEAVAKAEAAEKEADAITARMDERTAQRTAAIAAANMPVPGLGFGDGIVLMKGLPFDQASSAEQLRTSVAIAMSANPKLRVIRIKDGSLLDSRSMKLLEEMATDRDYQVWCEIVTDGQESTGIVMEDGGIKGEELEHAPT